MDQLSTREIASIAWIATFIIAIIFYSIKTPNLRSSLIAAIKSFFHIKIITSILLITLYIILILALLYQFQIWNFSQTKNTLFWYITFAIGTLFNINAIKENSNTFFIKTLKSFISLSIFLQFIINFHTFNFFLELLIIVPFITILTTLSLVANQSLVHQRAKKFCDILLAFIFLIFFIHFFIQIFQNHSAFTNYKVLQDFLTPIILTILYLPCLWFFLLYIKYEEIFVRLQFFIDDKKLITITKFLIVLNFRTQKDLVDEWFNHIKFHKIKNYKQLRESFILLKSRKIKRKNLTDTPLENGWSISKAEHYLNEFKLEVTYSDIGDNTWFGSKFAKLDNNLNPSTLTYYIQGNEDVVFQLKIKLFLYNIDLIEKHLNIYIEAINQLLKNSLQRDLTQNFIDKIYNLESFSDTINNKVVEFQYEKFTHSVSPTFEFSFCIKNPSTP